MTELSIAKAWNSSQDTLHRLVEQLEAFYADRLAPAEESISETERSTVEEEIAARVELETRNRRLQQEVDGLNSERQSLIEACDEARKGLEQLEADHLRAVQNTAVINEQLELVEREMKALEEARTTLEREKEDVQALYQEALAGRQAAEDAASASRGLVETELEAARQACARVSEERDALRESLASSESQRVQLVEQVSLLRTAERSLASEFEEQSRVLREGQSLLGSVASLASEREALLARLKQENESLKKAIELTKLQADALSSVAASGGSA